MKRLLIAIFLTTVFWEATITSFAQTWTLTSAPVTNVAWGKIALSANGNTILANCSGTLYISTDFQNFSALTLPGVCRGVASAADGTNLVAISSYGVYSSTNSGSRWRSVASGGGYQAIVSSADGSRIATDISCSTNSGQTWRNLANVGLTSLASSADGNTLVAGTKAGVYLLKDVSIRGSMFSNCLAAPTSGSFCYVTSSADGSNLAAAFGGHCSTPGPILTSADSGKTWTPTSAPYLCWLAIASSADGKVIVAASDPPSYTNTPNLIFTSADYGSTWVANDVPAAGMDWSSVACSADGNVMAAGSIYGGLWICRRSNNPTVNFCLSGSNCRFDWIVSSTNFIVQRNSDLSTTNWVTLTNSALLNLTNLHNEVVLQKPEENTFYRLIAQ